MTDRPEPQLSSRDRPIRCAFGLHRWSKWFTSELTIWNVHGPFDVIGQKRSCALCNKEQKRS